MPDPAVAPLQESVTLPSARAALTEQAVGAPQAVIAQRTLLLSLNAEVQFNVSVTLIRYLVYVPCVWEGVTTLLPLVAEEVTVATAAQLPQLVPSVEVQCSMAYEAMALVPAAAPLQERVMSWLQYGVGLAVNVVGAVGSVFRRTELEDTLHPE